MRVIILFTFLVSTLLLFSVSAQVLPLVYDVENTGANVPPPNLPSVVSDMPVIQNLPDPFMWADGRGRITHFSDWLFRRAEIGAQILNYEIGVKPTRPDTITASYTTDSTNTVGGYSKGTLIVNVTVNGKTLTLTSPVILPLGPGPFPAAIPMVGPFGFFSNSLFSNRNIAQIGFLHDQVTKYGGPSTANPYYQIYPSLDPANTGQYSAWAWGVSRLIDGLELTQATLPIDVHHLAVIGCSYAGKMALFAGAFDERIALTISQESGGGGATSWRYSHSEPAGSVELIDNTDYNWFKNSMQLFAGDNVWRMPEDHHELMAMVAPRALYASGNPDYIWLSNPSCYVCSKAAQKVYEALGIPDRFGFSVVGGHGHCSIPGNQIVEIGAFIDKFLLGLDTANTSNIADRPDSYGSINLSTWIPWTEPNLTGGASYMTRTSLVSPATMVKGLETTVTCLWNKRPGADRYFVQLSRNAAFASDGTVDSTMDTVKAFTGLLAGKTYYWRVQVDSAGSLGPWSEGWNFSIDIPLPAVPELTSVGLLRPDNADSIAFRWKNAQYADKYIFQMSTSATFASIFRRDSTADTVYVARNLVKGATYYWRVRSENITGYSDWADSSAVINFTDIRGVEELPTEYSLSQNYPNPFNPSTTIRFGLPKASLTKITVYDILGREIRSLVNKILEAGYHEVTLDSSNLPSGTYFYKIQSGDFTQTRKMMVLK